VLLEKIADAADGVGGVAAQVGNAVPLKSTA
jgi:hypothetical protein